MDTKIDFSVYIIVVIGVVFTIMGGIGIFISNPGLTVAGVVGTMCFLAELIDMMILKRKTGNY